MPFDASGNFTRVYNFQQDAANGIKILAARVDGEFDNIATGMNLVFFRDGRVPMQADLRMNINGITGLKDGALGSPAIKFNTDPNTGPYLPGLNQYGIQVNGVQRGVFTTAGFDVTGNFTASGTISEGGSLLSAKYAPIASPTFTGTPAAPTPATADNSTKLATTAYVQAQAYMPKAGGTFTAAITGTDANMNRFITPQGAAAGGLYLGARDNSAGTQSIYSAAAGSINMFVGSGDALQLNATTATFNTINTLWINGSNKMVLQHDGTNGFIRTQATFGSLYLGAGSASTLVLGSAGDVILPVNNKKLAFTDASGTSPAFIAQSDNNFCFYGTDAAGGGKLIWHAPVRSSSPTFYIDVPTSINGNLSASGQVVGTSPGSGTGGGLKLVADLQATNQAYIQITNNAQSVQWGYQKFLADGSMYWSGAFTAQGNITSLSDERVKSAIRPLENARSLVASLQGVRYIKDGKPDLGLIAQRVQRTVPEVVRQDSGDGMLSLDYGRLVALLINDNNRLAERIERLERRA